MLEPAQLRTLLRKSFNLGMDPDPDKPRALNRLARQPRRWSG
ncbi:MAG: hypothetical protein ACLP8S_14755 [Solirubrobacteraceae bacterium]